MSLPAEYIAIIEEEEGVLRSVLDSLRKEHKEGTSQLQENARDARELTAQIVAATRAEDKQQLASDEAVAHGLSKLRKSKVERVEHLLDSPYFGRIVVEEEDARGKPKQIEYKIGTRTNVDMRIIDWRAAPISKLYYEYREGDDYVEYIQDRERVGRVKLRRVLEIEEGTLVRITFGETTLVKEGNEWKLSTGTSRGRRKHRGALPDVLSLITPDQFKTITEDAQTTVLIQGVAGSGKTTVALYRLAWLLEQPEADRVQPSVIVVRSPVLRAYIQAALVKLNTPPVHVLTYHDWLTRSLGNYPVGELAAPIPGAQRVKQSTAVLAVLERYVLDQKMRLVHFLQTEVPTEQLGQAAKQKLNQAVAYLNRPGTALLPPFLSVIAALKEDSSSPHASLERCERIYQRLQLYREDLYRILERKDEIISQDETRLMDRSLLDSVSSTVRVNFENGVLDEFDLPLLVRLIELKHGGVGLISSADAASGVVGRYSYVVADEVQDFSPVEISTLLGAVSSMSNLTLVGDEAQAVNRDSVFPGWEKLRKMLQFSESLSRFISLSVSFRSTEPIMQIADAVLGERRSRGARSGEKVVLLECRSEEHAAEQAGRYVAQVLDDEPEELIAILCRDRNEMRYVYSLLRPSLGDIVRTGDDDSFRFESGVLVAEISKVKGLEFRSVILWNPSGAKYPVDPHWKRLLYVGITRAEERLGIVSWQPLSPNLPRARSGIYDLRELELPSNEGVVQDESLFDPYPRFTENN